MSETAKPVVVGVDGTTEAMAAARWAAAVADKFGSPLELVHGSPDVSYLPTDAAAAIRAAAIAEHRESGERTLKTAEEDLRARFRGVAITTARCDTPADRMLVDLSHQARMVVLGSDDVHAAAALLVGSTTLAVATHSAAPVVAWRGVESPTDQPVVVGVNSGKTGAAALGMAFEFADRFGVPLKAVGAFPHHHSLAEVIVPGLIDWDGLEALQWMDLLSVLQPWTELYPDVEVTYFIEQEAAGKALLRHVQDSQLVVLGNRSHGLLAGALLGSTSLNLLHRCPIPVMMCQTRSES